jgi:hypothetical protein
MSCLREFRVGELEGDVLGEARGDERMREGLSSITASTNKEEVEES